MEFSELLAFTEKISADISQKTPNATGSERVYARIVKLTEEIGELADEVLASRGDQRDEKLSDRDANGLGNEISDVLITTLVLAHSLGVNVPETISRKVEKIKTRYYGNIR